MGKYEKVYRGRPVEDYDFDEILDRIGSDGGESRSMRTDAVLEVKGYWHEMDLPVNMVTRFGIRSGDTIQLARHRVVRYGQVMNV